MIKFISTFLLLLSFNLFGQVVCNPIYFQSNVVLPNGDTINQSDKEGYYYGLHISSNLNLYTEELNKQTAYKKGYYQKGKPIGVWVNGCSDGSYSIGKYTSGVQLSKDKSGNWIERRQGTYAKINEWDYYTSDSLFIKTEFYERSRKRLKTYLKDKDNKFIILSDKFNGNGSLNSPFKRVINKYFSGDGALKYHETRKFLTNRQTLYHNNGQVMTIIKQRKILRIRTQSFIIKHYDYEGKLIQKSKKKTQSIYLPINEYQHPYILNNNEGT